MIAPIDIATDGWRVAGEELKREGEGGLSQAVALLVEGKAFGERDIATAAILTFVAAPCG